MRGIDPKFYNEDGSFNTEVACLAGRKAQAQTAAEGIKVIAGLFTQMVSFVGRISARRTDQQIGPVTN